MLAERRQSTDLAARAHDGVCRDLLRARNVAWIFAILTLGACASYSSAPPLGSPDLVTRFGELKVDASSLRLGALRVRRIDPARGLDPTDVAVLAVLNSPDLNAKRSAAKVAAAQSFAAGLLPDPQIVFTTDLPDHPAGLVAAYGITPTLDVMSLITHSTALKSARASARQADLDLLWSEWSTAQQARQSAFTALANESKAQVLTPLAAGLAARYRQSSAAVLRGDLAASVAVIDRMAQLDTQTQLATARHDAAKARGDLNSLIGLTPDLRLNLIEGPTEAATTDAAIDQALRALPARRPDLLALQAGYASQDANLRKSILAQFPLLNLAFSRQSDTGGVLTTGLAATVVVPVFNRGRGDIAVQTATRARLASEYQARLDQAVANVATARRDLAADQALLAGLQHDMIGALAIADRADAALARGDLDSAAALALRQAALKQQMSVIDVGLAVHLAQISLDTVLFTPDVQGAPR